MVCGVEVFLNMHYSGWMLRAFRCESKQNDDIEMGAHPPLEMLVCLSGAMSSDSIGRHRCCVHISPFFHVFMFFFLPHRLSKCSLLACAVEKVLLVLFSRRQRKCSF